jgi:hypothetical protein
VRSTITSVESVPSPVPQPDAPVLRKIPVLVFGSLGDSDAEICSLVARMRPAIPSDAIGGVQKEESALDVELCRPGGTGGRFWMQVNLPAPPQLPPPATQAV